MRSGRRSFLKGIAALASGATVASTEGSTGRSAVVEELEPASPPPELEERHPVQVTIRSFRPSVFRHPAVRPEDWLQSHYGRADTLHVGPAEVIVQAEPGSLPIVTMEIDGFVPLELDDKFSIGWKAGGHEYALEQADLIRIELRPGEMTTRAVFRALTFSHPLRVTALDERGSRLL